MEARDFFYIVGSVGFILISILVIAIFFFGFFIKRAISRMSGQFESFARSWGRLTLVSIVARILKRFLFK